MRSMYTKLQSENLKKRDISVNGRTKMDLQKMACEGGDSNELVRDTV
jgi:hypothetical protein